MAGNSEKEAPVTTVPAMAEKNGRLPSSEAFLADGMHVMFGNPARAGAGF